MVKIKESVYIAADGTINLEAWLQHVLELRPTRDVTLIRHACTLAQLAGEQKPTLTGVSCLQQGLTMAESLLDLHLDNETLAAALVYNSVRFADLSIDDVREHLGPAVEKLVQGTIQMEAISNLPNLVDAEHAQLENVRKMLLAMVQDMRVVVIKLTERAAIMRSLDVFDEATRQQFAQETMHIYAPLANRLGIGQLKWELEDLAFRYLQPITYREIANHLNERRLDREHYVQAIVDRLNTTLKQNGIKQFEMRGRAKHIYSIYRKMHKKKLKFSQLYDLNAVRILVNSIEDCYAVLDMVHSLWQPIPSQFDDHIATPKASGYRSIHTAVETAPNKIVEIQIRTHEMHKESEHGIAAHWRYKEGGQQKPEYEAKIAWLRQVLEWQKELVKTGETHKSDHPHAAAMSDDHVYLFTPAGEIIDLPQGATPLDFAYHVHSEVGHRCRGAKVNGTLVPLTYVLNTGEQVEILTTKQPNPSRDWLNPHLGYLKTARAKAKVHHWFKLQDYDQNCAEGQQILERECQRLGLRDFDYEKVAHKIHFKNKKDMLAALGSGDLRIIQVLNAIQHELDQIKEPGALATTIPIRAPSRQLPKGINIAGVGNLLTHTARCCKPLPGDPVIGYITQGRGIAIHRDDCPNVSNLSATGQARLIDVQWGGKEGQLYAVDIFVEAYDRPGLVRDVTTLIANEKINVVALATRIDKNASIAHITLTIEIHDLASLSRIFDRVRHIPNVIDVKRQTGV